MFHEVSFERLLAAVLYLETWWRAYIRTPGISSVGPVRSRAVGNTIVDVVVMAL